MWRVCYEEETLGSIKAVNMIFFVMSRRMSWPPMWWRWCNPSTDWLSWYQQRSWRRRHHRPGQRSSPASYRWEEVQIPFPVHCVPFLCQTQPSIDTNSRSKKNQWSFWNFTKWQCHWIQIHLQWSASNHFSLFQILFHCRSIHFHRCMPYLMVIP